MPSALAGLDRLATPALLGASLLGMGWAWAFGEQVWVFPVLEPLAPHPEQHAVLSLVALLGCFALSVALAWAGYVREQLTAQGDPCSTASNTPQGTASTRR